MKRSLFTMAMMAVIAVSSPALAQKTITWRMTTMAPKTSAFYKLFALPLVKRVDELTDGQVKIKPFPAGVIAPSLQAHDAVVDGTADAVQAPPINLVSRDPVNALLGGAIPGGMGPDALMHWMYEGGGKELLAKEREATMGLHSIPAGLGGSELLGSCQKPIRTGKDLKGVKFRTIGAFADILKDDFGAAPTVVPGSEVYTMLQRHAIDCAEWSGPAENQIAGLPETAKYIMYPGPQTNAFFMEFAVRKETWDALPKDLQKKIDAAAELATIDTMMAFDKRDMKAWAELKHGNNKIVRISDSLIQKFRKDGRAWAEKKAKEQSAKGDPWMAKLVKSYYSFYDNWLHNADYRAVDMLHEK